jgi:hypothetical protein
MPGIACRLISECQLRKLKARIDPVSTADRAVPASRIRVYGHFVIFPGSYTVEEPARHYFSLLPRAWKKGVFARPSWAPAVRWNLAYAPRVSAWIATDDPLVAAILRSVALWASCAQVSSAGQWERRCIGETRLKWSLGGKVVVVTPLYLFC